MLKIIAVGKVKETFLKKGCDEFLKRVNYSSKLDVIEIKDSTVKEEQEHILRAMEGSYSIALCVEGKKFSSESFAEIIKKKTIEHKNLAFIIGSAEGLHDNVKEKCDLMMSLSEMTFTHEMARLFLLEQIYRAYTIIENKNYHK